MFYGLQFINDFPYQVRFKAFPDAMLCRLSLGNEIILFLDAGHLFPGKFFQGTQVLVFVDLAQGIPDDFRPDLVVIQFLQDANAPPVVVSKLASDQRFGKAIVVEEAFTFEDPEDSVGVFRAGAILMQANGCFLRAAVAIGTKPPSLFKEFLKEQCGGRRFWIHSLG